ncbi:toxin glutamine deamidase domain-containing protein [Kitasatospora phosalacinea]|uniref:toxin glutamine deamidase domain-containing protein n=1 Tax=Kitasatospora phosalacinea TaxID=2065 RepID=UPI0036BEA525
MMLPGPLEWVLEMLGFDWPKADEDKLRECAQAWRDFADRVDEVNQQALTAANSIRSANAGDDIDAFGRTFDKFSTGGDGYLADAAYAARLIATAFDAAAMIVVTCKIAVIAQLAILATEIIAAQGAALFTFGLSEVAALGATQATKMIVRRLLKELRDALVEAVIETIKDPIVSAVQGMISDLIAQTVNQGFDAQNGYDLGRTAKKGAEEGLKAAANWQNTFTENLRDGLGSRAGSHVRGRMDASAAIGRGETGSADGGGDGGGGGGGGGDGGGADAGTGSGGSSGNEGSSSGSSGGGGSNNGGSNGGGSGNGPSGSEGSSGGSSGNGPSGSGSSGAGSSGGAGNGGSGGTARAPEPGGPASINSPATNDTSSDTPARTAPPAPAPSPSPDQRAATPLDPFGTRLNADGPTTTPADAPSDTTRTAPEAQASAPAAHSAPDAARPADTHAAPAAEAARPADAPSDTARTAPEAQASTPAAHSAPDAARPADTHATPEANSAAAAAPSSPTHDTSAGPRPDGTRPDGTPAQHADASPSQGGHRPDPRTDPNSAAAAAPSPQGGHRPDPRVDGYGYGYGGGSGPRADGGPAPHHSDASPSQGDRQHPDPRTGTHPPSGEEGRPASVPSQGGASTGAGQHGRPAAEASHAQPGEGHRAEDGPQHATVRTAGTAVADAPPTRTPGGSVAADSTAPSSAPYAGQAGPVAGAVPTGAGGVPSANSAPGTPGSGTPRADRPAAAAPTAAPTRQQRPDQARPDRPVTLGQQPTGGRPDPRTAPWRTPQPSDSTTPRPDARPAQPTDPRTAARPDDRPADTDPRRTVPEQRPSADRPDTDRPTPVDRTPADRPDADPTRPVTADRPYGEPGGLVEPGEQEQRRVEDAVPRDAEGRPLRHPDPEGDWPRAVNGDPDAPGRRNNCVDVALATVDTYSGHPTPAAARTPDHDADGNPSDRGERGGRDRMENALGAKFSDLGDGPAAYRRLEDTLRREGHGSQAVIVTRDADGRGHAWNAVNHKGKITYIDAQTGRRSDRPLHNGENGVFAVPLGADRRPTAPAPHADPNHDPSQDRRAPEEIGGRGDNGQNAPPGTPRRVERPDFMGDPPNPYGPPGSLTKAQIEQIQVYRANEEPGYRQQYYDRDGHRKLLKTHDESGHTPPQLAQFEENGPWLPAKDEPEAPKPHYLDAAPVHLGADGVKDEASRKRLDELAKKRDEAVARMLRDLKWKKESGLPEADAAYSASQYAMQEASRQFGEESARLHYMALQDAGFVEQKLLGPKNGNDQFDQVWKHPDGRFVVVEAKGSPEAPLGTRLVPGVGRQRVSQGSREYFLQIIDEMIDRGETDLARQLTEALAAGKVEYVLVAGGRNTGSYNGLDYQRFDISRGTLP